MSDFKGQTVRCYLGVCVLLFAGSFLPACGLDGRAGVILGLSGDASSGEAVWNQYCSNCHGADGSGGTEEGILGEVDGRAEFVEVVLEGDDEGAMPAFAEELSNQEIADLTAWTEANIPFEEEDDDD